MSVFLLILRNNEVILVLNSLNIRIKNTSKRNFYNFYHKMYKNYRCSVNGQVEDKSPLMWKLQIAQTILIIILLIGLFILIAMLIGSAENATNFYNYHV